MYILQKKLSPDVISWPQGGSKHSTCGKMLAPHFKDEIASLQKWPFLAGFGPFLGHFFY